MSDFDYTKPHNIVNGDPVLLTDDEIAEVAARDAAWAAGAPARANALLLAQIDQIETQSKMPRAVREMMLKNGTVDATAAAQIKALDDQIAALRVQIVHTS